MNLSLNNIRIKKYKGLCKPKIEEKLIFLKKEKESLLEEITSLKNTLDKKNNNTPYYSYVIRRQNSHSPDSSILLHEFLDDKKVTYRDITNKIDMNELCSKIKNIIINTERIKSSENINLNIKKPRVYLRKTKSSFSCRQTNSSFTTENESKNSTSVKNIFVNKNIIYRNKQRFNDIFSFNLNLNNYYNKYNKENKENKTYENGNYYNKTLREYLNDQVKNIQTKRNNLNEVNMSNIENDHNYSIDNENKELIYKEEKILDDIDDLLALSNSKNKNNSSSNKKIIVSSNDNKSKNKFKTKIKNIEEKINYNNNKKISNYLGFKQNNIKRNLNNLQNKKLNNNTFRNSNIKLNLTKHKTMKNLNSNIINNNIKTKNFQCINYNKLNDFILPKPFLIKSKININNNINKKKTNICKSFSMLLNIDKINNKEQNENINTANICSTNNQIAKKSRKKIYKNNKTSENKVKMKIKVKYENKDKRYKNRKNYSDIIRSKFHSSSRKKIKVKIENINKISNI